MTQAQSWVPPAVDVEKPSVARMYDYLLGGSHNFAVDRATAVHFEQREPGVRAIVRLNRAFMARVVRYQMAQGVRQFLDLGSGIPTVGNVHEIAHQIDPSCRVVYVDRDPVAVAHSELMLAHTPGTGVVQADVRAPETILDSTVVRQVLDFDEPIGVLCMLLLHWLPGDDLATGLLSQYRDPLAAGSYLGLSHATHETQPDTVGDATDIIRRSTADDQLTPRSYEEVLAMFGDFELVEPGLVGCASWRPAGPGDVVDTPMNNEYLYGGLARKP